MNLFSAQKRRSVIEVKSNIDINGDKNNNLKDNFSPNQSSK